MFSNEISELLSGKPIEILKMLAKNDPEKFRKNVASVDKNGCSFFIAFLTENYSVDFVKELFTLCEEHGYDFKGTYNTYQSRSFYKYDKSQKVLPEYLAILANCFSDDTLAFLTEKMGKDELLKLESEGWQIMETAFEKGFLKTVQILCDYGLKYETTLSGVNILKLIERSQDKVDLYWKIKEKDVSRENLQMSGSQFEHFRETIKNKIAYVDKKKDYQTQGIIDIIKKKNDVLSVLQKEKLLYDSVACKDMALFKFLVKSLGYKLNSDRVNEILLANLNNGKTQEFLYMAIECKENLFIKAKRGVTRRTLEDGQTLVEVNEKNNVYGIDQVLKLLFNLSIHPFDRYHLNQRGTSGSITKSTNEKLLKLFNSDHILLEKMDNGLTLFEKIASTSGYFQKFQSIVCVPLKPSESSHLSAIPSLSRDDFALVEEGKKELTLQQAKEIKDFLHKTWMNKDENGNYLLTKIELGEITKEGQWLFSPPIIMHKEIFSLEEKISLFNYLINSTTQYTVSFFEQMSTWNEIGDKDPLKKKMLKSLYQSLVHDDAMKWSNVVIKDEAQKLLKTTEFLFEVKARQLEQELKTDLNQNNDKTSKPRTKI